MSEILLTVVPVFAMIAIGFAAAQFKLIAGAAALGLRQFVFLFAIPALLFRTMVEVEVTDAAPWALWGAYFSSVAIVWAMAAVIARSVQQLGDAGGAAASTTAVYGNLVMLGIPLALPYFGPAAALPAALILSIHSPVLLFVATLMAEWAGRGTGKPFSAILQGLIVNLLQNPIIAALVLGSLWRFTGWGLHPVADKIISLLSQAGVPAALFALGLSLAAYGLRGQLMPVAVLLALKMAAFPAVAWVMVTQVFFLPPVPAGVVVLFAAMPPGATAYLFASQYRAAVAPVSGAIALGTALSLVTVSVLLWLLGPNSL
jgi:predicted permease